MKLWLNILWKKAAVFGLLVLMNLSLLLSGCTKGGAVYLKTEAGRQTEDIIQETTAQETLTEEPIAQETSDSIDTGISDDGVCYVYICGAVKNPGVYQVSPGSRVYEVIEKAGGLSEDAAANDLNQAQQVTDGQMLEILTKQEQAEKQKKQENSQNQDKTLEETSDGLVNINKATVEELMTLHGIGAAKAAAIVEYREANGAFVRPEDIKSVSGIGEGLYGKIQDKITTGNAGGTE